MNEPTAESQEAATLPPVADDWDNIEIDVDKAAEAALEVGEEAAERAAGEPPEPASADHPANPALVPLTPPPKLTEFVPLSVEEIAEKGRALAREYVEIEALESKRSSINAQIKAKKEVIDGLVLAITSGQVEVPVQQQDLLRQPIGAQEAARAFEQMAEDAKAAAGDHPGETPAVAEGYEEDLNKMAADIQAGQGIGEPGEEFKNDIENFKAKAAAKRKGKG